MPGKNPPTVDDFKKKIEQKFADTSENAHRFAKGGGNNSAGWTSLEEKLFKIYGIKVQVQKHTPTP